jgi:hypothetical protein
MATDTERRWDADVTYVDTACGFAYTAFETDLFSLQDCRPRYLLEGEIAPDSRSISRVGMTCS